MKKILIIVGTRPNFIKVTQFKKEAENFNDLQVYIAHTGQHYDKNMSEVFFEQFQLYPDYFLDVSNKSVCTQMGDTMAKVEGIAVELKPDILLAVGDVNSTLAAALVANKLGIKLGHIESGLRSRDRSMPEEINRLLTDEISDHYFVTEQSGLDNLRKEKKSEESIHFVGNTMIDTMVAFQKQIEASDIRQVLNIKDQEYILLTIHRPSNVDEKEKLERILDLVEKVQNSYLTVFPVHPRTKSKMKDFGLLERFEKFNNLIDLPPLDYFSFQHLIKYSKVVVTDSGGIQEETTFQQIPCITIRDNTERPSTTEIGTNTLMKFDIDKIFNAIENAGRVKGEIPELWDGKATQRILKVIEKLA